MKSDSQKELKEEIGVHCLTYLSENQEAFDLLIQASGLSLENIVETLQSEDAYEFLFDFLLHNEPYLVDFCARYGLKPEIIWKVSSPAASN